MCRPPLFFVLLLAGLTGACGPSIGDACSSGLDCSSQGTRLCDLTQPGGYCTLPGCERGTCPEEGVCVLFRPATPRLSTAYCMFGCEEDSDCREDEGYRCLSEDDFGLQGVGMLEATVLDGNRRFCAVPASLDLIETPPVGVDGGMSDLRDAAAPADAPADAMDSSMPSDAGLADDATDAGPTDAGETGGADAGDAQ